MLLSIVITLIALYVLLIGLVAWISLHPVRTPIFVSPSYFGAPQEEVEFENGDDLRLRGWWLESVGSPLVAICAHGYVMNRAELTPVAAELWKLGCSCLLFEFRAHGKSEGTRCGLGWLEREDVRAAVQFARSRAPGAKVVLIGSSMGAAACAFAMADHPELANALVLDSGYSRLSQAISGWWRFVGGTSLAAILWPVTAISAPLAGFNPYRVDVARALRRISVPTLLLHGTRDDLARPPEAERNRIACNGELCWLEGSGHTEGRWLRPDIYMDTLIRFLRTSNLLV